MQVTANVFITAIHGLRGDTSAVAVTEGPATSSPPPWSVTSGVSVRSGGPNESYLSYFMFLACIICFNKLSVNMCEKNDFLKALMPCRGRKITIRPAGSFTKG